MTAILADFDLTGLPDLLTATNKRTANNERRSYGRTVNNWNEKPTFNVVESESYYGNVIDYKVVTNDNVYRWVDEGTDAHIIKPKKADGFLRFQEGYSPKTAPNKIVSSGSGVSSGDWRLEPSVKHPGIEPRNFTENIKDGARDRWSRALQTEIKKYVESKVK